jgi:hypothetical protein
MSDDPSMQVDKTNPDHYSRHGELTSVNLIAHYDLGFEKGNALKYLLRAGDKPGETEKDDLLKAIWYLNRWLYLIDPKNEPNPVDGPVTR